MELLPRHCSHIDVVRLLWLLLPSRGVSPMRRSRDSLSPGRAGARMGTWGSACPSQAVLCCSQVETRLQLLVQGRGPRAAGRQGPARDFPGWGGGGSAGP